MAKKEHEMLFKLGARLNQNFNGTFNSAQKALRDTKNEISALNKVQGEVNAYQKQQESLENTEKKLEKYKRQLENVRRELAESGTCNSELANKEEDLKEKIGMTEVSLAAKNQKLNQMSDRLSEAGVDVTKLSDESKRLAEEMTALKEKEEKAAEEAEKFGRKGTNAFEAVGSALAAAGISSVLSRLKEEFAECVSISMEFGSTMSTVEALTRANVSEMKELSSTAKELGANTAFTANQSAEAMTYMGMAGWKAQQMISGMNGVMNLAAASGEDLGLVSDIVPDNLTAFGLKASDTAHFSDVLAAAAANSNTSVSIMGETFKGSASVAGALGYSIEDVAVAVGLMANSGVKGSIANTALKNTFNGLLEGVTLTSAAFGEAEYTAVNADGSMKDLRSTIDELRIYFDQMTEAEKVNNAQAIAGQRGYNGLLAVINSTDEDYTKLTDTINNCTGAAKRMADIKLDNLKGDVTLLDSAADGLKMTVGELWNDELRGLAQIGTEILTGINEFCEKNPAVVKTLMAVTAEVGLLMAGYTAFNAVKQVKNTLDTLGIALNIKNAASATAAAAAEGTRAAAIAASTGAQKGFNLAVLASPMGIALGVITAATAAITVLREVCKQESLETQTLTMATKEQCDEAERLNAEYEEACGIYGETSDRARALKYDLDEANGVINSQSFSVKELYAEIDTLGSSTDELLGRFRESTASIDEEHESARILTAKLKELTSSSDKSAAAQAKIEPIIERLNEMYPSLGLTIENVTGKIGTLNDQIDRATNAESMDAKYKAAKENLTQLYTQQAQLKEASDEAEVVLSKARKNFLNTVGNNDFAGFFQKIGAIILGTGEQAEKELDTASEKADSALSKLWAVQAQIAESEAILEEYGAVVNGMSEEAVSAFDAVSIAVSGVEEETQNLLQAYNDAYQAAYDSVNGQYALWDQAAEISAVSADTINSSLESQAEYWKNYNDNLRTLSERTGDIEGLSDIIASFADGSKDSVNAIAGMAGATDEDLQKMADNWRKVQREQEEVSKALADTRVDFDGEMEKLVSDMEAAVNNMNMEDNAAKAAKETIRAYAESIAAGKGQAVDAADQVAIATARALGMAANENIVIAPSSHRAVFTTADSYINAYASGTDSAERGAAVVGENGPEIVVFRGGEAVYNAKETKAILGNGRGGGTAVTIAPSFIINGGGSETDWREAKEKIVELIKDTLRDEGIDARRGAYA